MASNDPSRTPTQPSARNPRRGRLQLSATQLIASALAAVTAAVVGSYLGVSGTVVGAAVASVATVLANAIYSHSIHRTSDRVRTVLPASARRAPAPVGEDEQPEPAAPSRRRTRQLRVVTAACAGVFVAVLGVVTAVELVAGRPLSDLVHDRSAQGTTVFGSTVDPRTQPKAPTPTPTVTVTASVVVQTPTVTSTAPAVTRTTTPTLTRTAHPRSTGTASTPTTAPTSTRAPTPTSTPTPAGDATNGTPSG